MSIAWSVFFLGLVPSYVSALVVEKYYTSFWTAFWNLWGIFVTATGLALDGYNGWWVWGLFVLIFLLLGALFGVLILFEIDLNDRMAAHFVRKFGSSFIATSFSWALIVGFTFGAGWGVLVFFVHGGILLGLLLVLSGP